MCSRRKKKKTSWPQQRLYYTITINIIVLVIIYYRVRAGLLRYIAWRLRRRDTGRPGTREIPVGFAYVFVCCENLI